MYGRSEALSDGSSPREWGTLRYVHFRPRSPRFIPTRVGNTTQNISSKTGISVHPHASGEHSRIAINSGIVCGSSPREWGTLIARSRPEHIDRFIPTRVGNTQRLMRPLGDRSVHPHASGEHIPRLRYIQRPTGSSPREWGTPAWCRHNRPVHRFIPTRVGNTRQSDANPRTQSVHPHASGEHTSSISLNF